MKCDEGICQQRQTHRSVDAEVGKLFGVEFFRMVLGTTLVMQLA